MVARGLKGILSQPETGELKMLMLMTITESHKKIAFLGLLSFLALC